MPTETVYMDSPVGLLEIRGSDMGIEFLWFVDKPGTVISPPVSETLNACIRQLEEYFQGDRIVFDLPLKPSGTVFQEQVWKELQRIPYSDTISYIEVARRLGDEKSVRAVGTANGTNPIAIIIPCHRVIGANGKLVGYAGKLWRKEWLLKHEATFGPKKADRLF